MSGQESIPLDADLAAGEIRREIEAGAYSAAERLASAMFARIDSRAESLTLAVLLESWIEARVAFGNADPDAALVDAQRVLRIKERLLGPEHLEVSRSLHVLADVHVFRGDFGAAVPLYGRAVAIRQQLLSPDNQLVADSLDRLAFALVRLDTVADTTRATRELDQALKVRQTASDASSPGLASTLEVCALRDRYAARYDDALSAIDRALAIRRRHTPDHPLIAFALLVRGDVLWLQGDAASAARAYVEAIALAESTLDRRHPLLVVLPRMLGLTAAAFGNLADARQLRQQAVDRAQTLPPCHPEATGAPSDFALTLRTEGDYVSAETLYRRVLAVREKCLGPIHSRTATTVFNLGDTLNKMGDLREAERLQARAAHDWSASVGPTHPYVALALDAQAQTVAASGDLARAEVLFKKALTIRRKSLPTHPNTAATLVRLANLTDSMGRSQEALVYLEEAATIYTKTNVSIRPHHMSGLLMDRGRIEARRGEFAAAHSSFETALVERERMYGPAHPFSAESRAAIANLDLTQGRPDQSLANSLAAEKIGRAHVRATIRYLPERQAVSYASTRPGGLDLAVSVVTLQPQTSSRPVFEAVMESRGVVLDELIARNRTDSISQAPTLRNSVLRARQRYAELLVRTLREPVDPKLLDDARRESDEAERALAGTSVGDESSRGPVTLADIDAVLPKNSALLSFVVFDQTSPRTPNQPIQKPVRRYGAFVHRAGEPDVVFVVLGSSATIDRLVTNWRAQAGSPSPSGYRTAAAALRRAVWDPVANDLGDVSRIFVVPDGLLSIVNFAALPTRDGRYIAEVEPTIHYLSTERDLLARPKAAGRGLFAVGGASFDGKVVTVASSSSVVRAGCDERGGIHFADLPGSRREVDEIRKIWTGDNDDQPEILSGVAATETAVKQGLQGRRMVHFATHGFVFGTDCLSTASATRSVGGLAKRKTAKQGDPENPLLLSGLAFAGANERRKATADQDDGVLTAEEIAALNLQGTEWAVLSACNTGLGEIKAGEGVFGLRRAFQVAGARTVIMSLWSVEDRSATDWMRALYQGRLEKKLDTAAAVHEASLTVLRDRRARGQSTHPFYWAGFVAAGDWK